MSQPLPSTALTAYKEPGSRDKDDTIALDSLPYIDNLHPDYEAYALTLIEEEMQQMVPPSEEELLRHLPNPLSGNDADSTPVFKSSKTQLNRVEYEGHVARQGQPRTDSINYLQIMCAEKPNDVTKESEWNEALEKAKIELEYERLRMVNAELQTEYESSLWKHHTMKLESISNDIKNQLIKQKIKVDEINAKRKDMQVSKAAPRLHTLSQKWDETVKRVKLLSNGVGALNNEVEIIREKTGIVFAQDDNLEDDDDDGVL